MSKGPVLDVAPRTLTFRFDEVQQINAESLDGIRLTRAGDDGLLDTADDQVIVPGLVSLGDNAANEVVVRFAEPLPDDLYKAEVFSFTDDGLGITGLTNRDGEFFQPSNVAQRIETTRFDLRLGTQIESVVPQPVVRRADGSLSQNRNEIVVYFNEDPLFVEDVSAQGTITAGGTTITVTADLSQRSLDDTQIIFDIDPAVGFASAIHDSAADTITVTYPVGTSYSGIALAINSLEGFSASVTAGGSNGVFVKPIDPATGDQVPFQVTGVPSERSAENPRFYQLLLTQDTVSTSDDALYFPENVIYDPITHTARLFFASDLNQLGSDASGNTGVPLSGGTFRLRIGTAVDDRVDLILPPMQTPVNASASSDFGIEGFEITLTEKTSGELAAGRTVRFVDTGSANLSVSLDANGDVVFNLGGDTPTIQDLKDVVLATAAVDAVIAVSSTDDAIVVPARVVGAAPLRLSAVGDTLSTALDVGIFGTDGKLTSRVYSENIDALPYFSELPGSNEDPGHSEFGAIDAQQLVKHVNASFGADAFSGITEIAYNFNGIYESVGSNDFLNQIDARQKDRIREAVEQWGQVIGVQFHETVDEGITIAVGNGNVLVQRPDTNVANFNNQLGYTVRIDEQVDPVLGRTFSNASLIFSTDTDFETGYGENFYRTAMTGIGFLLGLEAAPDLPPQTLMNLNQAFINDSINVEEQTTELSPVFPGNYDILHGQHLHRPDSIDVDLYRFEVDLGDPDRVGTLTAETFAERLADSSLLDTTLTLFEETQASAVTDFGRGVGLSVRFDAVARGIEGNHARMDFILTNRTAGDNAVGIHPAFDTTGSEIVNVIIVDLPRGSTVSSLTAGDVISAINESPLASSIFRASLASGLASDDIRQNELSVPSVTLRGGGVTQLSRNDDYFSEDSRIIASLSNGTYYIGIAASGNDNYDPSLSGSGFGGLTQGAYDLNLKFEPQVDEADSIRDLDDPREGVPGTLLDGDGDGQPGGNHNFWFQTRSLDRIVNFTENGSAVSQGQTIRIVGSNGVVRTYEFVPLNGTPTGGNVAVPYNPGTSGFATPAGSLAQSLRNAINSQSGATGGVSVLVIGTNVIFSNERSIELSSDFRAGEALGRTLFVDKTAGPLADGSLARPFNNINNANVANAFGAALPGDIVRIVGNGGADQDLSTESDNFSYQFGLADTGGGILEDGRNMEVPQGVTTMIDAGAAFKLRGARISVGSSTLQVNRSGGALQVLGTPRLVDLSLEGDVVRTTLVAEENVEASTGGLGYEDGSVIFTSLRDRTLDLGAAGNSPAPSPGDWGGLVFRRDLDVQQGIRDLEDEGIFLQRVNHAEIRYGGSSNVLIDSVQTLVNPIQLVGLRPTISYNEISFSADAAISATPNSFAEDSYQSPRFQQAEAFTADYSRIGPDIFQNQLLGNSVNGLFVRSETSSNRPIESLTVAGRFDDTDIVHYLSENLIVTGSPGGSIADGVQPSLSFVTGRELRGGSLAVSPTAGVANYEYRMTFVDANGFESKSTAASDAFAYEIANDNGSVELIGLPVLGVTSDYVSRRLYRAPILSGAGNVIAEANRSYVLVAELDSSTGSFIDDGGSVGGTLDINREGVRGRLDGSLVLDPGLVLKLRGSRIELGFSTTFLAEGLESNPIVLTSSLDDRFGAGGTFDTNNDNDTAVGAVAPARGDWSGIYAAPGAHVSIDHATIAFGGGISLLEGGSARGFAPLELQQATGRITNSRFEFNASGQDGSGESGRQGRLSNLPAVIFVRGSQPTIVANEFIDNRGSVVSINSESLSANFNVDEGRQTGSSDRITGLDDNRGPLIRRNTYEVVPADDVADRQFSILEVIGGGVITTETVFDDTDIVHTLASSLVIGNFHSSGGLKLYSRPDESLVVKLTGGGNPNSPTDGTGLTATGSESDISDRIGGSLQIIGRPGAPVVLTSLADDTVGAGRRPDGSQFTDSNGDSFGSRPKPNDWRSILLDQFSNDRNVDVQLEQELPTAVAPGSNGDINTAQFLGQLASNQSSSDDQRRLGFEVEGFLGGPTDIDTYSFTGVPGTEVWIDVDNTSFALDSVIELLDANGNLLARSDNSQAEIGGAESVTILDNTLQDRTTSLQGSADQFTRFGSFGQYADFGSQNPLDAGIHLSLPGAVTGAGDGSTYFFRIRSASVDPNDAGGGLTNGAYRFQIRLQEQQEFPGSVIRYTDIRYANHGIHIQGLPGSSPLLGEAQENESTVAPTNGGISSGNTRLFASNDELYPSTVGITRPFARAQHLGNLLNNKSNVISVGGSLENSADVDFYQFEVNDGNLGSVQFPSTVFDIDYADGLSSRPDTRLSVFYDPDGENGPRRARLVYIGASSNIAEDQTSPLLADGLIERLDRGSVSSGDPFIGPVALNEGTYYVAVTEEGQVSEEFSLNESLRVEPLDSVERIVVDRVNASPSDTGGTPQIPRLFDETVANAGGFIFTTDRSQEPGHGDPRNVSEGPSGIYDEGSIPVVGDIGESLATAFDLDGLEFSTADNATIGGALNSFNADNSTEIPHVTVNASLANDLADFYQVVIPNNNTRVILDVDKGFDTLDGSESFDVDVSLVVINASGFVTTPNPIEISNPFDGGTGSLSIDGESVDPFFDGRLNAGVYFIGIVPSTVTVELDASVPGGITVEGDVPNTGNYTLNVSIENHALSFNGPDETSLHFDRGTAVADGTLASESFDLSGYTSADQPRFYFNYLYSPAVGDEVTYVISSDQLPTALVGGSELQTDDIWHQNVVDLASVAGHTGVQVTFNYNRGTGSGGGAEGLYLDDFIVGFAERGEEVFLARPGRDGFVGNGTGINSAGQYQLELRRGTPYARAGLNDLGQVTRELTRSFDTNDRHAREITLVAPAADQIAQGSIFEISDGAFRQRFQFELDAQGGTAFDAIPIRIASTATSINVATAIRDAINQASQLQVEAASTGGLDDETMTDNRLNLFGAVDGSFAPISSFADASAGTALGTNGNGLTLIPAVLFEGTGDRNFFRPQGAVIIESNKISDVRAIGIWSESGIRDTDDEDLRADPNGFLPSHPFLQQPLVGNPYPGAVRNLPASNDEVLGGLAPGVVLRNNTIDQAGYSGIKVEGETRPIVISGRLGTAAGSVISDGHMFAIDAAGTRVVFEFDDVSGTAVIDGGSGVSGGDGVADGHVPIYYRHFAGVGYNDNPTSPGFRAYQYSNIELMTAVRNAIQGSILVTNGLAKLVTPVIGPDPFQRNRVLETGFFIDPDSETDNGISGITRMAFPSAAVYLYGATGVYASGAFQKTGGGSLNYALAPISDPVQPVAQIVNNTIYGADGTESQNFEPATREANDLLQLAIDTKVGRAHAGPYLQTTVIEEVTAGVPASDVDFYRVELMVGDRLIVDIDTPDSAVDTVVQLFNAGGVRQDIAVDADGNPLAFQEGGLAPDHLDPASSPFASVADLSDADDPFVDFTVTETGTYYVAVSSSGHVDFDPKDLSGRGSGTGGTGEYQIGIQAYTPRSLVMSLDNGNEAGDTGTKAGDLVGTTFTVTQIPDFAQGTPAQNGGTPQTVGNQITFEFTSSIAGVQILNNGNINVPLITDLADGGYRTPDIMRAIQEAVEGVQDPIADIDIPTIPNHESGNGPQGRSGPITRATATALGGRSGANAGIVDLTRQATPSHWRLENGSDFTSAFGHNRREDLKNSFVPSDTLVTGDGTTELYVLWENIAEIELSPGAIAAGLKLTPDSTKPQFSSESDQLLAENGILLTEGTSSTILNNVIVNTHQSIVSDETSRFGFGANLVNSTNGNVATKLQEVVVVGNAFQHDEPRNSQIRFDISFPIDFVSPFDIIDNGLSTDAVTGATNVSSDSDDFNFVIEVDEPLLINPAGNNFKPDINSIIIDSAINTLPGRDSLTAVAQSVGLPVSNIIAPDRDVEGILRADNPDVAPPGGLGSNIFKDRGSNEVADFVGPVALLESPHDNDALGIDTDGAVSFLRLNDGIYREFRVQLQDNGDASDPFIGTGIDDTTVMVSEIPGLRSRGANVALFEDDRLLTEGIDYTFNYDETRNVITLKPLAGIWRNDRAYRIVLNNRERSVLVVPGAAEVRDGDQVTIIDSLGGELVFEFEAGFSLLAPEPITLQVPDVGTNAGGVRDGDIFQINDGVNPVVVFELNQPGSVKLPGTVEVFLSSDPTPTDPVALETFRAQIAANLAAAIQTQVDAGSLDVDVRVIGSSVVVGAERNTVARTSGSGLNQPARTLALVVPDSGNTIADGDELIVSNGSVTHRFEFDVDGDGLNLPRNLPINIGGLTDASEIAIAIRDAIATTNLEITPLITGADDEVVYLNLPCRRQCRGAQRCLAIGGSQPNTGRW